MDSSNIASAGSTTLAQALRKPSAGTTGAEATTSVGAHGDTVTLSAAAREKAAGLRSGSLAMDMSGSQTALASTLFEA